MTNSSSHELNTWQKIAAATDDWLTPANFIDGVAFAMAMRAGSRLEETSGIAEAAIAFGADFIDGKVARATGTASPKGEAVDAAGDKIKLGYYLVKIWQDSLAPKPLMAAVGIQNATNVAITAYDRKKNPIPQVHPNTDGKHGIFMQQIGLGMHVIGNKVAKTRPETGWAIKTAGTALTVLGIARGLRATKSYWQAANS